MITHHWKSGLFVILRAAAATGVIAVETAIGAFVLRLNPTTAGFVYLVTVLVIATRWGLLTAAFASVVATVCLNFFFIPPVHTFHVADPQNWVALFAFLVSSLLTSQLSERARRRAAEAEARQRELEQLQAVSRAILTSSAEEPLAARLAAEIARIYGSEITAIHDSSSGQTFSAGAREVSLELQQKLNNAAAEGGRFQDESGRTEVIAFGLQGKTTGAVALVNASISAEAMESLANLVAIGLEKSRNQQAAARANAARQAQEFKSTMLDALAHEFMTPLTSIKAAATSMLPGIADPEQHRELASVIEQEVDRLSALVNETIHLSRIEAGKLRLEKQPCQVAALIDAAARQMEPALAGRATFSVAGDMPAVVADPELLVLVLRHLLDNALKYAGPDSPIRVIAAPAGGVVRISIWNGGPVIPDWEKPRLFERYYRGSTAGPQTTGSGMGLPIAREVLTAHGGSIRIESSAGRGTEVSITLPAVPQGVAA